MNVGNDGKTSIGIVACVAMAAVMLCASGAAAAPPTVNGLYYGDGDVNNYPAEPYEISEYGSSLYVTLIDGVLYVCLVVTRDVNDNVFSPIRDYTSSAGWGPPRGAHRLIDSEFAEFFLTVGTGTGAVTWNWQQGYGEGVGALGNNNTNENWVSDETVSGGLGTPPPGIVSDSSLAWNMRNYAYRINNSIDPGWNMGPATPPNDWTSPITNPGDPNNVINAAEGYPEDDGTDPPPPITYSTTYQWEWPMVYEWAVDISQFSPTSAPVFVVTGSSHHSPSKNSDENDDFEDGNPPLKDFGDLPTGYPVLLADDGARHVIDPAGAYLGASLDNELDGQPSTDADEDDTTTADDEDGVELLSDYLEPGSTATLQVTAGAPGYLSAFIDFEADGTLEQMTLVSATVPTGADPLGTNVPLGDIYLSLAGVYEIVIEVGGIVATDVPARFRFTNASEEGGNSITGEAASGEVEDYILPGPTAVVVSRFEMTAADGVAVAEWETSSESGTIGFNLYRRDAKRKGAYEQLNADLLPGLLHWPTGGTYRFRDLTAQSKAEYEYRLEELDLRGKSRRYGPWTVTVPDLQDETAQAAGKSSEASTSQASSMQSYSVKSSARGGNRASLQTSGGGTGSRMRIALKDAGVYRVSTSDIATALGVKSEGNVVSRIHRGQVSLTNRGRDVAWQADGDGLLFYGEALDSIYADENVYWLELTTKAAAQMEERKGKRPKKLGTPGSFSERLDFEEDVTSVTATYFDADADTWVWATALGSASQTGSMSVTFEAPDVLDEPAELRVRLKGLTNQAANPDHQAGVYLNGTYLGGSSWNGFDAPELVLSVAAGALQSGTNTLVIEVAAQSGASYSYVGLDGFEVRYTRALMATGNWLSFTATGPDAVTVGGFTASDIQVWDISDPTAPVSEGRLRIGQTEAGQYGVSFYPQSASTPYVAFAGGAVAAPWSWEGRDEPDLKDSANGAAYVVIAPEALRDGADSLAAYRAGRGLTTRVVTVEEIFDAFNYGIASPEAIRDFLGYAYAQWSEPPRYAALAGRGSQDYRNLTGYGDCLVPPLRVATAYGVVEQDADFGDADGDRVPEISVGRLPVTSNAGLAGVLAKLQAYESGGDWRQSVLVTSDNSDDDGDFTTDSDTLAALAGPDRPVEKIYLGTLTTSEARTQLFDALESGRGFMSYLGHAGLYQLAQEGLLTKTDVAGLTNAGRPPVVLAGTCTINRFGQPGVTSLGEELVAAGGGGAVAVWAPVAFTLHLENMRLVEGAFEGIFSEEAPRLGDALTSALKRHRDLGGSSLSRATVGLMGDPATELAAASPAPEETIGPLSLAAGQDAGTTSKHAEDLLPEEEETADESAGDFGIGYHGFGGYVFNDANRDGQFDEDEAGLAGVTVTLKGVDLLGNAVELAAGTNAHGGYYFIAPEGNYTLTCNRDDVLKEYPDLTEPTTPETYTLELPAGQGWLDSFDFGHATPEEELSDPVQE